MEYLKSSGGQYIEDTTFKTVDTGAIEIKTKDLEKMCRFAGWGNNTETGVAIALATPTLTTNFFPYKYGCWYNDTSDTLNIADEHTIYYVFNHEGTKVYLDGILHYSRTSPSSSCLQNIQSYNFRLFQMSNLNGGSTIYYCKVFGGDDVLLRNYIPVRRNSDNVLGMYDTVTNTFYTNSGTGSFIAGPVVDTCENPLTIMGTEICAENTQPSGTYLVARQNGNKYYINLSEEENPNNPKPITNESNNVLRIKIGNTIYNAHDSSVSE